MKKAADSIKNFIAESRRELLRVNWPSKKETFHYTIFVIILSLGLAAFLGLWDFIFLKGLQAIVF